MILSDIANRYYKAVIFHSESRDLFAFLSFQGFSALHEYQAVSEAREQTLLKKYIIETTGEYAHNNAPPNGNILDPILKGNKRFEISNPGEIVKAAWTEYRKWEAETLDYNENAAFELMKRGDIAHFSKVQEIIADVSEELRTIENFITTYNAIEWDLTQIRAEQSEIEKEYNRKLRKVYR